MSLQTQEISRVFGDLIRIFVPDHSGEPYVVYCDKCPDKEDDKFLLMLGDFGPMIAEGLLGELQETLKNHPKDHELKWINNTNGTYGG